MQNEGGAGTLEEANEEIARLRGLLVDPGHPAWEDARSVLVAELRKAEMPNHARAIADGESVSIPSHIALNLIALAAAPRPEAAGEASKVTVTPADTRLAEKWKGLWGSFAERLPVEDLAYALASARPTPAASVAEASQLAWLASDTRLSLLHYSPMYGDDDDQSDEWRVVRESGPINDREWTVIGRGNTPVAALRNARALPDTASGGGEG